MLRRMPSTIHRAALRIAVCRLPTLWYLLRSVRWLRPLAHHAQSCRVLLRLHVQQPDEVRRQLAHASGGRGRINALRHRLSCIAYARTARAHRGGHSATESTGLLEYIVIGARQRCCADDIISAARQIGAPVQQHVPAQPYCGSRTVAAALWQPCRPIRCRTLTVDRCYTDKTTTAPRLIVVTMCGSCCADH